MPTIQTHMVGSSGPYAYRVHGAEHPDAGPNDQYWDYLGPVGKVDPEELTDDETAELREEGFALARFRDGESAELHMREEANRLRDEFRERWPDEDVLAPTDDRRKTVVQLAESAPRAAQRELQTAADEISGELAQRYGQAELDDKERKRIDWSKDGQNVFHARAAKAALQANGVSDWEQVYSGDIESDGWDEIAERNRESMSGKRDDNQEQRQEQSKANAQKHWDKAQERALKGVRDDKGGAREHLRDAFGMSDAEIDEAVEQL